MDNFLLNVLAGVIASLIFYIISKLFRQVKTTLRKRVVGNLIWESNSKSLNNFLF